MKRILDFDDNVKREDEESLEIQSILKPRQHAVTTKKKLMKKMTIA